MTTNTNELVSNIISCKETQDLLHAYGLNAHAVTWEDTARTKNSCFGPNISDMSLIVKDGNKLMPVIRKPNFSDLTTDTPIDSFNLRVGNEKDGAESKIISLKEYLSSLHSYCPDQVDSTTLYNERDTVVLTSTQCCVLPVKKGEKTEFAVQLFNYQSYNDNPAVLVVLVSKDGTSTQIIERSNQKLLFNDKGDARYFTVERLEDVRQRQGIEKVRVDSYKEMKDSEKRENSILMIQIPLEHKAQTRYLAMACSANSCWSSDSESMCMARDRDRDREPRKKKGVGMDMAQIGLGSKDGKFIGTKGLKLVRDTRFPIRCTVQYYRVTDENYISEKDITDIADQLTQSKMSSLVLSDTKRTTEPNLKTPQQQDDPYGKLSERDYLNNLQSTTTTTWGSKPMFVNS